jgi:hypothetical protein
MYNLDVHQRSPRSITLNIPGTRGYISRNPCRFGVPGASASARFDTLGQSDGRNCGMGESAEARGMMHRCEPLRTANDTSVAHVLSSGLHAAPGGTSEGSTWAARRRHCCRSVSHRNFFATTGMGRVAVSVTTSLYTAKVAFGVQSASAQRRACSEQNSPTFTMM